MKQVKDLEKYAKEITRKHIKAAGYRMFEHPSYASVIVLVKGDRVAGMTNRQILRDNAATQNKLENENFLPFEY